MKIKFSLFFLFFFGVKACFGQIALTDLQQLHDTALYKGGQEELAKKLANNLRYPLEAMKSGRVGTVLGVIKLSNKGKILATGTLNKADENLKREFERVAKLTENNWAASDDTFSVFYAVIPVEFRLDGKQYMANFSKRLACFREPVLISGFSTPATYSEPISKIEQLYVSRANKFVQKEKYDKAIEALEYLLNLQPLFVPYYQNLVMLNKKAGNSSEAAYYRQLLQLINSKVW